MVGKKRVAQKGFGRRHTSQPQTAVFKKTESLLSFMYVSTIRFTVPQSGR